MPRVESSDSQSLSKGVEGLAQGPDIGWDLNLNLSITTFQLNSKHLLSHWTHLCISDAIFCYADVPFSAFVHISNLVFLLFHVCCVFRFSYILFLLFLNLLFLFFPFFFVSFCPNLS